MNDKKKTKAQLLNELSDLRQHEQAFRALVEHSPDLMARFDKNLRYLYVNPAFCRVTGRQASAYIGHTNRETGLPEDRARFWDEALNRVFASGLPDTVTVASETTLGSRVFEVRMIPEFADDESIETVISLAHDVTDHEQVQEALQASQHRLALAVEVTGLSIYDHAVPLDETTYHSERWGEILGYALAELPPPAERLPWVFQQVHPDDLSTITTAYNDFVEGRTPGYSVEIRMKHKAGHWVWVTGYSQAMQRDEQGRVTRVLGIMQDITKHKQLEQLLRRQAETLQTIIDNIPVMIAFFDPAGRYILVNRAWEQTLGWRLEEVKDRFDLLNKLCPNPNERQRVLELIGSDEPGWHEFKTRVRSGQVIDTAWTQVHLSDGTRISLGQDISELKKMRDQLFQVQRMDSIGRLAGGIAHDLNNMLVPILGYAELALLQLSPDSDLYTRLTHIKTGAERAGELTRQILAFSRRQVLTMRVVDLNVIIAQFEAMIGRIIGEDIELKTFLAADLKPVKADRAQIEQVLLNLVVNARDAMPQGGQLTLETANVFLDEMYVQKHVGSEAPGPYVMLAVSDSGYGMDAETQERISEPFFTTKDRSTGTGTGMGLATVFGIVKQHQGNIWVYSEPGQGITFKIYLPQVGLTQEAVISPVIESGSIYGTETILVVEDEALVRKLVCETLEAHRYQVIEADNAAHCLQLAADYAAPIHLLLTDVIMPRINGQELYQQLQAVHPESKVLFMSGYTDNVISHHSILTEDVNFLQKPFTIHNLTQTVRRVLG